jgi:acyl dehydratase
MRIEPLWYEDYIPDNPFTTLARTVTETDVVNFVALSGMYESLFMDLETLRREPTYSGRLVPGSLVFVLSEGLIILTGLLHDRGMAFLGLEMTVRRPVYVGDTIRVEVSLAEKRETRHADRGIVTTAHRVLNQRDEETMQLRVTRMIRRRPVA